MESIEKSVLGGIDVKNCEPHFKTEGGHWMEDLALQNIQARGRMIFSYMLAQLLPTPKIRSTGGYLLVRTSSCFSSFLIQNVISSYLFLPYLKLSFN